MGFPGASTKRPLVVAKDKTPSPEELVRQYQASRSQDNTYVGGYSDQRFLIDNEMSRTGKTERGLPFRLHWARALSPKTGQPDGRDIMNFQSKGYQFLMYDEAASKGYTLPPGAMKTADGHIRLGDVELMYCSDVQAAEIEAQGRSAIDEKTSTDASGSILRNAADKLGSVGQDAMKNTDEMNWTQSKVDISR